MSIHSADLIKDARKRLGLSQIEVACAADVSRRTVQNAESGKEGVKWTSLQAIAEVVGVDLRETLEQREADSISNSESFSYWPFGLFQFVGAKLTPSKTAFCENEEDVENALEIMWQNLQVGIKLQPEDVQARFHNAHPTFLTKTGYFERYLSIWRANPSTLSFSSSQGKLTGVSIILPVSAGDYADFINGRLSNFSIAGQRILQSSPTCIFESLAVFTCDEDLPHRRTDSLSFIAFHQLAVLTESSPYSTIRVATFAARDENMKRMMRVGVSSRQARIPGLDFQIWELSENNLTEAPRDDQIRSSTLLHFAQLRRRLIQSVRAKVTLRSLAAYKRLIQPATTRHNRRVG